jgi:hypothetical protein
VPEGDVRVRHRQEGFEPAQHAIAPPLLGQLDRRPPEVAAMLLEPRLEPLEQGEGVGRRAGEPCQHPIVVDAPHLARGVLQHRLADGHLPVASHGHPTAMADRDDRRRVDRRRRAHARARGCAAS